MRHAIAALIVFAALPVQAFELTGAHWDLASYPGGVPYCPRPDTSADARQVAGLPAAFAKALDDAMYAWTNTGNSIDVPGVPCSAYVAKKSTCSGTPSPNSTQPWVYWEPNWGSVAGVGSSTIGVTPYTFIGSITQEAMVLFNDRDYYWAVDGSQTDVGSIAVHELGHFVGLDHYDEYSYQKQQECYSGGAYPSVLCSAYGGGTQRIPTADDAMAVCTLYPQSGAVGSPCTSGGSCDSGLCHASGYCTKSCAGQPDCPLGYLCDASQCKRDVPPPSCPVCGPVPCTDTSMCIGASGAGFCTNSCTNHTDCPLGFYCAPLTGGGSACYPLADTCGTSGPGPGQACTSEGRCRLGDVCLQINQQGASQCFEVCRQVEDCPTGQVCRSTTDPALQYCDVGACSCNTSSACNANCACDTIDCACACNSTTECDTGCSCDPHCNVPPTCACNTTATCDGGCACDPNCGTCGCNAGPTCDLSCTCDPDCAPIVPCACDDTYACNPECACDPECLACTCDDTFGCDSDCDCDPECEGCLSAVLVSSAHGGPRVGAWAFLLLAGLPLLWSYRRRSPPRA